MSKIKFKNRRLTVSVGKTVNLGDFNSLRVDAGLSADVPDNVDLDDAYEALFEEVEGHLAQYEKDVLGDIRE